MRGIERVAAYAHRDAERAAKGDLERRRRPAERIRQRRVRVAELLEESAETIGSDPDARDEHERAVDAPADRPLIARLASHPRSSEARRMPTRRSVRSLTRAGATLARCCCGAPLERDPAAGGVTAERHARSR